MSDKNKVLFRFVLRDVSDIFKKGISCLVLGPRQVGKTTLIKHLLSGKEYVDYPLQNPSLRINMESDPGLLIREIEVYKRRPLVYIDEAQKVPAIFDAVQYLIDNKRGVFILTGSSARKLRRKGANLLPGRIRMFYLGPLMWGELGLLKESYINELQSKNINKKRRYSLDDIMVFGSLPPVVMEKEKEERQAFLRAYSEIYLEEEIRAEALSRKIGAFARFLELAALESGTSPNLSKLSQSTGVSQPAIKEFYNILVDTLIIERVDPYLKNARKRLFHSSRYYFFDIGVRNVLARLPLDYGLVRSQKGILFEHLVMLEIINRIKLINKGWKVNYWRTQSGAEVDCIIDMGAKVIPIEIKSSDKITMGELQGLKIFLQDYKKIAPHGYVIVSHGRKQRIADNITLLPWDSF